ncbi:MAG TPA: winged helix DNA-binding domain-containing protein [Ktedonobacterales bacterium]
MASPPDIAGLRLHAQQLAEPACETPAEVVARLGAVQSQDFAAAKWAVGQRMPAGADADIQRAFDAGAILRTHVMRPTWHFILPADIRWMQMLTAPRVRALLAYYDRKLELDRPEMKRSKDAIVRALEGGKHLTRPEMSKALARAGIVTESGQRVGHILMHAELDALICSGAQRGKQQTYALVAERAPQATTLSRDEALATLTERYFTGHGPATVKDYAWWSGLTTADAQAGLDLVKHRLAHESLDGKAHWRATSAAPQMQPVARAYLLPNFDEFTVGYADRSTLYHPRHATTFDPPMNQLGNVMVLGSQLVGMWKRSLSRAAVTVTLRPASALADAERLLFLQAAQRYGDFLGLSAVVEG